ncbi:DNA sulfur modification protein DndB [Methanoculleus sp.]|uniref:DNA sulfur modification protein DndB n=1 Tax=Methanoculleus sp. TaxID=90427 RepID=UPI00261B74B2|nr:DNA sulfur modification protein DndB [Methanoculleus sp.]
MDGSSSMVWKYLHTFCRFLTSIAIRLTSKTINNTSKLVIIMKNGQAGHVDSFEDSTYHFPAIRGIQAGKEYYITMFPLKSIVQLFSFDDSDLPPKMRAQRTLNHARIPVIANYLVSNPKDYVLSSITASVDSEVQFVPIGQRGNESKIGKLIVPMAAKIVVNDGQHRKAAIEAALRSRPELGLDTISVVLFMDSGLKRCQQMFADLNKHAVPPTKSLGILYDNRDPFSQLVLSLLETVPIFDGLTEFEKTTISNRSVKMFTLSSIYQATEALLGKCPDLETNFDNYMNIASEYWNEVYQNVPEWQWVVDKRVTTAELRKEYIHAHGVALHALGRVGHALIEQYPDVWREKLPQLQKINWSRENTRVWEGRAMVGGRINKSQANLALTSSIVKIFLGLQLTPDELTAEKRLLKAIEGPVYDRD